MGRRKLDESERKKLRGYRATDGDMETIREAAAVVAEGRVVSVGGFVRDAALEKAVKVLKKKRATPKKK